MGEKVSFSRPGIGAATHQSHEGNQKAVQDRITDNQKHIKMILESIDALEERQRELEAAAKPTQGVPLDVPMANKHPNSTSDNVGGKDADCDGAAPRNTGTPSNTVHNDRNQHPDALATTSSSFVGSSQQDVSAKGLTALADTPQTAHHVPNGEHSPASNHAGARNPSIPAPPLPVIDAAPADGESPGQPQHCAIKGNNITYGARK